MASAKEGFPQIVRLFARELASLDPAGQPERAAGGGVSAGSSTSS